MRKSSCTETAIFDITGLPPEPPFPPGDHAFVDLCVITGGTELYEGASGYIQEVGTFDFSTGVGQLEYSGELVYGS